MAYETCVDGGAREAFRHPSDDGSGSQGNTLTKMANIAGAVVSLALISGIGVWGYKLMMRDVTGIPIVRAVEGDMRTRPDDPGGELAQHQGLSVNAVAADGGAKPPAERLVLAPQPVALTDEDVPIDKDAVAIVQQAIADQTVAISDDGNGDSVTVDPARVAAAARTGSVEDLAAAISEDAEPHRAEGADDGPEVLIQASATSGADIRNAVAEALAGDNKSGMRASLRPHLRPAGLVDGATSAANAGPRTAYRDVDPETLPVGTRLVQLGAYETAELARSEWDKTFSRFDDLMVGKDRVVQQASSGGRNFYRLRATGFEDLADARRFCAAIVADGADCIPVVTR